MKKTVGREGVLWKRWRQTAKASPKKIVLIDAASGNSTTAAELTQAATAFATRLETYRPGDRIAFRLPNGVEWMALFLALQRAGLAAMPLDPGLPAEACLETARRLRAWVLYLDGKFVAANKAAQPLQSYACIKVTSGSTGEPKAIECRAKHLVADGCNVATTMRIRPRDLNLATIPLGHSYGLGNLVMPLILQGTAMVCAAEYVPRQLVEWIGRYRVTVFPSVPAIFRVLAGLPAGTAIPSLRTAISAGAPLSAEIAQAFAARFGIRIHNFYGSSETGGICYDATGSASLKGRSIGKPLDGVRIALKNGRVEVAGAAVATRTGRWRLADCAEWNSRGELVLLGRGGAHANIGGKKVHPLEVERTIRALPSVTDVAVWLVREKGRDLLVAAVETNRGRAEIEQALAAQLPAWKLPKAYILARELPRSARGKMDLPALKATLQVDSRPSTIRPRATST